MAGPRATQEGKLAVRTTRHYCELMRMFFFACALAVAVSGAPGEARAATLTMQPPVSPIVIDAPARLETLTRIGFDGLAGLDRAALGGAYAEGGFQITDTHGTFRVRDDGGAGTPALFLPNAGRRGSYALVITRPDGGLFSLVGFTFAAVGMHLTTSGSLDGTTLFTNGGGLPTGNGTVSQNVRGHMVDRLTFSFATGSRGRL